LELPKQKYIGLAALAKKWDMEVEDVLNLAMENLGPRKLKFVRLKFKFKLDDYSFYSQYPINLSKHIYPLNLYWQDSTMFRPHIRIRPAHIARIGLDSGEYYLEVNETKYPELIRTWNKPANPAFKLPIKAIKILRSEIEVIDANASAVDMASKQSDHVASNEPLLAIPTRGNDYNKCSVLVINEYFKLNGHIPDVKAIMSSLRSNPPDGYDVVIEGNLISIDNAEPRKLTAFKRTIKNQLKRANGQK